MALLVRMTLEVHQELILFASNIFPYFLFLFIHIHIFFIMSISVNFYAFMYISEPLCSLRYISLIFCSILYISVWYFPFCTFPYLNVTFCRFLGSNHWIPKCWPQFCRSALSSLVSHFCHLALASKICQHPQTNILLSKIIEPENYFFAFWINNEKQTMLLINTL